MTDEKDDEKFMAREAAPAYTGRMYTIEEYLEFENASPIKHEYYQGKIVEMQGASRSHAEISSNLMIGIGVALKGGPCKPYASDLRIHIRDNSIFTYPDISIMCNDLEQFEKDEYSFLNPSVIIEILSPSTRNHDINKKFDYYKSIPSLREYILVDSKKAHVVVFLKSKEGLWEPTEYDSLSNTIKINTAHVSLPMKDVYDGVDFNKVYKIESKKDRLV